MKALNTTVIGGYFILYASTVFALSTHDNLGVWRNAPYVEQARLCDGMVNAAKQPGLKASSLCTCISEAAGEGGYDFMKVAEVAAACIILMK